METDEEHQWLEGEDRSEWLREEYRLLSEYWRHADNYVLKTTSHFATLSGGLLAFLGSTLAGSNARINRLIVGVGIVVGVSWLVSVVRLRENRSYLSDRIRVIEQELHSTWPSGEFQPWISSHRRDGTTSSANAFVGIALCISPSVIFHPR